MKLHYYPETDSLYINLSAAPSVDSKGFPTILSLIMVKMAALWVWISSMRRPHSTCRR